MAKKSAVSYQDLVNAYKIMFVKSTRVHLDTIQDLQTSTLRKAYKKLALQNHPDRSQYIGVNQKILESRFKQISSAYAVLDSFITGTTSLQQRPEKNKKNMHSSATTAKYRKNTGHKSQKRDNASFEKRKKPEKKHSKKKYHRKEQTQNINIKCHQLPPVELLLGQYLFYSGHISLKILIEALQWQRTQRPSFGEIAMGWNILDKKEVIEILRERNPGELFGDCASRLNYINKFQYRAILAKQQNMQQPIGRYFIEQGILNDSDIALLCREMSNHNSAIKRQSRNNSNSGGSSKQ